MIYQVASSCINFVSQARNVSLPGVESFTTVDSLIARFLDTGFNEGHALTLKEIRRSYIESEELSR
jgi:[phosphatase 2A protein]-leucine-carboxy methyltransferase